jgi:hypothetical protein
MAKRRWKVLPGGQIKHWKGSSRGRDWMGVPPHWYRNLHNRRERQRSREAIARGGGEPVPYVYPREAAWYW